VVFSLGPGEIDSDMREINKLGESPKTRIKAEIDVLPRKLPPAFTMKDREENKI
jgi:hypothetical protein